LVLFQLFYFELQLCYLLILVDHDLLELLHALVILLSEKCKLLSEGDALVNLEIVLVSSRLHDAREDAAQGRSLLELLEM
jgi:hypothetical protein